MPIGHGDDVGHAALRVTRFVQGYVGRASDEILTIAGEDTGHSNVTLHADDVRAVIEGFAMLRAAAADAHALLCAMQTQCAEPTLTGTLAEESERSTSPWRRRCCPATGGLDSRTRTGRHRP